MGWSFLCFRPSSSPRRSPKRNSDHHRSFSFTTSIVEFMKPKKKKKKQHKVNMMKELTLEQWFSISSPCRNDDNNLCINNGSAEPQEHNNWVFPSSEDDDEDDLMSNSRHSFSQQRLLIEVVDCGRRSDASCLSSRRNGKVKKRVSFKLPEAADILFFCSPKADPDK